MSSVPEKTKAAPISIELTVTLPAKENMSAQDLSAVTDTAKKIKDAAAAHGTVEGCVVIGRQKFPL